MPDPLQVLDGRFTAERKLGRAASGDVVYLARDMEAAGDLPPFVALRVMPAPFANDAVAARRFAAEAQRIVTMRQPNVASVYIARHERGRVSFASEYIAGDTLDAVLEAHRTHAVRFPLFRALTVLRVVAAALDAIHAAGLAHGNVAPHNIIVERTTGRPVLTDFGVAWTMRADVARGPELDLYGLACTAFELFTGSKPALGVRLAPLVEQVLSPVLAQIPVHPRRSCVAFIAALEVALGDFVLDTRTVPPPPPAADGDADGEVVDVLVIDSASERGQNIARAIERAFQPRIAHARVASSAADAIELAREKMPHVVALDLEMPGVGSIELLSRLRELAGSEEALVVGICSDDPHARWRYGALGVSTFVERSLRPSFLARMVVDVLAGGAATVQPATEPIAPIPIPSPLFTDAEADTDPASDRGTVKDARRVLMVEDDHDILDAMRVALGAEYDLTTVDNGALALALLSSRRFDVIVLDLFMPGVDGEDVLRALRARRIATPVVLASASPNVAATAREFGTAGYLKKPFSLSELEARLESAVYRSVAVQ
ncbi:MAG: Serine/threonine protein kinase PrkC, regulator of stationary phase [Myxococcaceae bacterium]|nr:Serine/threonine protein kinase PrkC, regulator of stationary phase [Myxococcaceae bacterium]